MPYDVPARSMVGRDVRPVRHHVAQAILRQRVLLPDHARRVLPDVLPKRRVVDLIPIPRLPGHRTRANDRLQRRHTSPRQITPLLPLCRHLAPRHHQVQRLLVQRTRRPRHSHHQRRQDRLQLPDPQPPQEIVVILAQTRRQLLTHVKPEVLRHDVLDHIMHVERKPVGPFRHRVYDRVHNLRLVCFPRPLLHLLLVHGEQIVLQRPGPIQQHAPDVVVAHPGKTLGKDVHAPLRGKRLNQPLLRPARAHPHHIRTPQKERHLRKRRVRPCDLVQTVQHE